MARQSKPHLSKGYWRCRIDGRTHWLGKDERQAWAKFHRFMAGRLEAPGGRPVTIAGAIDTWLRLHTQPKHLVWLRLFAVFAGRVSLAGVSADLVHNYRDHLLRLTYQTKDKNGKPVGKVKHYAQETIRNYLRDAVSVLRMAAKRKWCEMPEVPQLDKPEFVDRGTPWAKLSSMLDKLPDRAGRILRFIAVTGCRPGEACGLRWEQVHVPLRKCVIPRHKTSKKTGEPRVIALNDDALDVLYDLPQASEHVFLSRFQRPYTVGGLRSILKEHCGITTYALRHSYAQANIDQGTQPEIVTKMLGQKTSQMVWTYARIRDEQMVEAARKLTLRKAEGAA